MDEMEVAKEAVGESAAAGEWGSVCVLFDELFCCNFPNDTHDLLLSSASFITFLLSFLSLLLSLSPSRAYLIRPVLSFLSLLSFSSRLFLLSHPSDDEEPEEDAEAFYR